MPVVMHGLDDIEEGDTYLLSSLHSKYDKQDAVVTVVRKSASKVRVKTRQTEKYLWAYPNQLFLRGV